MTEQTPLRADDPVAAQPDARARFLETYRREVETTKRILRAFPADQAGLKPSEKSASAQQLAHTFVVEQSMAVRVLQGGQLTPDAFPPPPTSWDASVAAFDDATARVIAEVEKKDPHLTGTVQFFTGPKQMGDYALEDFLWFLLHDQIHHRGQLSVYVRMAGATLPSIYGPTADEPWN